MSFSTVTANTDILISDCFVTKLNKLLDTPTFNYRKREHRANILSLIDLLRYNTL